MWKQVAEPLSHLSCLVTNEIGPSFPPKKMRYYYYWVQVNNYAAMLARFQVARIAPPAWTSNEHYSR